MPTNLKTFVGCKIIQAEPMTKKRFNTIFGKGIDFVEEDQDGYHVVYPNPDGELYHSWSPKKVFKTAYRQLTEGEVEMAMAQPVKSREGDYE